MFTETIKTVKHANNVINYVKTDINKWLKVSKVKLSP
jgi:hypothetical protein